MIDKVSELQSRYDTSDDVWFFVKSNYRIIHFNKRAAKNSIALHNKEIAAGDSILDYARDTSNKIDSDFITCFGKAAAGQNIEVDLKICYKEREIWTRSSYTPVYKGDILLGISILVTDITHLRVSTTTDLIDQ
ncbi:hypothetical protein GZH53_14850 [Flavihumibacter sp. R14]|nr:hypothetical protein [Flavihumibacter soli]